MALCAAFTLCPRDPLVAARQGVDPDARPPRASANSDGLPPARRSPAAEATELPSRLGAAPRRRARRDAAQPNAMRVPACHRPLDNALGTDELAHLLLIEIE